MSLTGPDKGAILLMTLGDDAARNIVGNLDDDEMHHISKVMMDLGSVESEVVEKVVLEFIHDINESLSVVGNSKSVERFLKRTVDKEKLDLILRDVHTMAVHNIWERLTTVDEQSVANFLKNEYPQTTAVILSKLNPARAARILGLLSKEYAFEVIKRMLTIDTVNQDAVSRMESMLKQELTSEQSPINKKDNSRVLGDIFNYFDRANEEKFMALLEDYSVEFASKIRRYMFTFKDLASLDQYSMQSLIKNIDKSKLPLALKNAPEGVYEAFTQSMSQRAAKLLVEEMEGVGAARTKDIYDAQVNILNVAKDMISKGLIKVDLDQPEA